jgi:hypothetical protein
MRSVLSVDTHTRHGARHGARLGAARHGAARHDAWRIRLRLGWVVGDSSHVSPHFRIREMKFTLCPKLNGAGRYRCRRFNPGFAPLPAGSSSIKYAQGIHSYNEFYKRTDSPFDFGSFSPRILFPPFLQFQVNLPTIDVSAMALLGAFMSSRQRNLSGQSTVALWLPTHTTSRQPDRAKDTSNHNIDADGDIDTSNTMEQVRSWQTPPPSILPSKRSPLSRVPACLAGARTALTGNRRPSEPGAPAPLVLPRPRR